jgi:3D (Asp-Asp-Asp) domain-containing protein
MKTFIFSVIFVFAMPEIPYSSIEMLESFFVPNKTILKKVVIAKKEFRWVYAGSAEVTAFCRSCPVCDTTNKTADGTYADYQKRIVAADPAVPFGTQLKIDGIEYTYTVRDRGQAIRGRKIDVLMSSHWRARQFGRQTRDVWILQPVETEIELEVPEGATLTSN